MKDSQEIKYILSGLYGVLALVASVLLVLVWRARPTERCRVPLHVLLVVAPLVRLIEQLISFKVYQYIQTNLLWLQVLMDLLPELLFWQAFVMLVLLWVEMYHFSRNKVTDPSIWAKMSLTTVFGIFSFLAYACAGGFAALMEFTNKYDMMAEAIFLTVLTLGAMIVFVHYGYLTHKRMDRVPLFPPHRKTRRLNRMKFTVVSVVICNILHIAYLYVVDVIDKMRDVHTGKYFLWIWMAYFIFTEILPAAAILIVFRPHHTHLVFPHIRSPHNCLIMTDKPLTDATLTIRVIKSFPYRTSKNIVLHNLDLTTLTVGELKERVKNEIIDKPGWKPYKAFGPELDSIKLYTKAHGTKTMNLIINMEDKDEKFMFTDDGKTLADYGCEHETEVSMFKLADYKTYKANPEEKW